MYAEALKFDPAHPQDHQLATLLKFDSTQPRDAHGRWVAQLIKARQEWIPYALEGYPGAMEAVQNINKLLDQTPEGRKHRVALWDPAQPRDKRGRWAKQGIPATMAQFKARHPAVAENYPRSSHTEMGTIEEHTGDVGREWQTQLTPAELKGISDRFGSDVEDVMTAAIALHDIGKAEAIESGAGKSAQHEFTIPILQDVMRKEGFSDKDITLATELTNHDLIGPLFRGYEGFKSNEAKVVQAMKDKAQKVGMSVSDFVTLQLAFYYADASAYPYVTQYMRQEPSGKWTFSGNKKIAAIEALLQSSAKREYAREPAGAPESKGGQFARAEGAATAMAETPRTFTSEEGYEFHEKGPVAEWAKALPHKAWRALDDYRSFGYHQINDQLRGTLEPRLEAENIRPATPEEVAKARAASMSDEWFAEHGGGMTKDEYLKKFGYTTIMHSDKPGPPDDPWHRLLDEQGNYIGHVTHIPYTSMDDPANWVVSRLAPNMKPIHEAMQKAHEINTLIREQGYELPEAIRVERGAYIPGLTYADLKRMEAEGAEWEEKGFTSTGVGSAGGRMDYYPVGAKDESLYNRFGNKMNEHQNETGAAIRFHIDLPKGTKVASVEALRRLDYEFPRKPITDRPRPEDVAEEHWTETDYSREPKVNARRLEDKGQRSESELVLGSGARFRVVEVRRGKPYHRQGMVDTDIIDVYLEYIGGGSSEGVRH